VFSAQSALNGAIAPHQAPALGIYAFTSNYSYLDANARTLKLVTMTDAARRLASLHDARETFFKGLKNHEHTIYQLGYEDGFSAGWEAAVNRLSEVKPGAGVSTVPSRDLTNILRQEPEEIPAHDTLMAIIEQTPGLLRQQIVETARKGLSTLNERTVRTALQRMKTAGELVVEDNRWYVAEKKGSEKVAAGSRK
jgi:hypothetical protein